MQKKSGIIKSGLDAMPLYLLDDLLNILKTIKHLGYYISEAKRQFEILD